MKWINPNFCSMYGDQVRVELGAQIVELPMTEQYLDNSQTMPYYQEGNPDAYGQIIKIDPNGGEKTMHCVDWKERHAKKLWKVYERVKTDRLNSAGEYIWAYDKVAEFEDKDEAIKFAKKLRSFWQRLFGVK